ncbi:MAG: glycosyltransferase [Verrucomicrobia bacterium]|nr:glycosyltransferase [Verrucomicrobiota bacterium]
MRDRLAEAVVQSPQDGASNGAADVVLISTFPRRSDRGIEDLDAVASYVDHLAPSLGAELAGVGRRLIIVAPQLPGEPLVGEETAVRVMRCWAKNTPWCYVRILRALLGNRRRTVAILIQFEFNMFGGAATTGLFPVFLVALRCFGWKPCVMVHQVVEDLTSIATHIGLADHPMRRAFLNRLLRPYYWMLVSGAHRVVVHEDALKARLDHLTGRPVGIIPHGCGEFAACGDRLEARRRLGFGSGEFALLCFGFLAHYKGSDWIVHELVEHVMGTPGTPLRLLLAGGESPNHRGKPHYASFVKALREEAAKCPDHVQVTGFVADEQVPAYFAAADLAVFPYRTQMAASGPLAIALSLGVAFLVSEALRPALQTTDFAEAFNQVTIVDSDVVFALQPGALASKALALCESRDTVETMGHLARIVGESRNWSRVARDYRELLMV